MICPLLAMASELTPSLYECKEEQCAWWCSDVCAIVQIAKQLHYAKGFTRGRTGD